MSASIWRHYEKIPGTTMAKCILCSNEYSYKTSITNLKKHLHYKHLSAFQDLFDSSPTKVTAKTENDELVYLVCDENGQASVAEREENGSNCSQSQLEADPADDDCKKAVKRRMTSYRYKNKMAILKPRSRNSKSILHDSDTNDSAQSDDDNSPPSPLYYQVCSSKNSSINETQIIKDKIKKNQRKRFHEMDDMDLFFSSMSQSVKKLPKIEQCRIKLDIHKCIHEAELRYLEMNEMGMKGPF